MARPLTKTESNGVLYARPASVEAQIDEVVQLAPSDLRTRLLITDRDDPGYLRHECLVHLMRKGRRSGNETLMSAVLPVLLGRCEANLTVTVPDGHRSASADLRQEILDELTELFVMDGSGNSPDALDFYECRFNKAFRALRIDAVRCDVRRRKRTVDVAALPPSEATGEPDTYEDAFARMSDAFKILPTQEWDTFRAPFLDAIEALPPDERDAVILVHVFGYKEEANDPEEETAATRCNCKGRTIRNRLTRAAAKLSRFKENL
jgi:hypothetical protein